MLPFQAPPPDPMLLPPGPPPPDLMGMEMGMGMDPMRDPMLDPMAMGPEPLLPPPPPVDPLAAMPSPMGALIPFPGMMIPPPAPGPKHVPEWAKPKKPTAKTAVETAEKDKERFQGWVAKVAEVMRKMEDQYGSVFSDDAENSDIEPYYSSALKSENDRLCAWGHNHDITIKSIYNDTLDEDESADKEDAGYYWLECWRRQHARAGYGDLQWSLFDTLLNYGRLATMVTCDFTDGESGFSWRMLDPATTFPFFEAKRGLHHVSLVYTSTASEILGFYGDEDGKLERKLKKQISKSDTDLGLEEEGEVVEWIDRKWHAVYWNGVEIKCTDHGYGVVPVIYDRGPGGRQAFTSSGAIGGNYAELLTVNGQTGWVGVPGGRVSSRLDESKVGLPFQYSRLKSHRQMEAMQSVWVAAARYMVNPQWIVTQGYDSEEQGAPELDIKRKTVRQLREDEKAEAVQLPILPPVLQAVMGQMMQDQAMSGAGPVAFGQNPAAQTTGSAAAILDTEGKEIWAPWIRVVQQHLTSVVELTAKLYADWGELMGNPGSRGEINVPRHNDRAGMSQAFTLTPEMIRRVGIRFDVLLSRFNSANLAANAAAVVQLMSANVWGQEDSMRFIGWQRDIRAARQRMRDEQLDSAPEIVQADQLRRLAQDIERAERNGDEASRIEAEGRLKMVAFKMEMAEQEKQLMMQSMQMGQQEREMAMMAPPPGVPPEMMLPPGGQPPGAPGAPSPIPQGGTASLPQFGIQPGNQGGRPMGPPSGPPGVPPGMING